MVLIPFGERNGHIYGANEVRNGRACECVCPSCGAELVAKQGAEKAWHFAHYPGADPARINACMGGETALHKYAKQVLVDSVGKVFRFPSHPELAQSDIEPSTKVTWARAEQPIEGTNRTVDVLLRGQFRRRPNGAPGRGWERKIAALGVEVCVTNPKELDYQMDLMKADTLSVIELSLPFAEVVSKVNRSSSDIGWAEAVRQLIRGHSTRNRRWLYVRGTRKLPDDNEVSVFR